MAERLIFDIFAQDHASKGFVAAGKSASAASDQVAGLARRLDEIGTKSAIARVGLKGNKEASAQLDQLQVKLLTLGKKVSDPKISLEGYAKAAAQTSALEVQLDKLDAKAAESAAAVGSSAGGLAGPSGMGALIGAGVVLSPVLITLGTGLLGVAAAAYGTIKPITNAASKTGGLQKNMAALTPEQQGVARSLLTLGQAYAKFSKSLQPEVLAAFDQGIKIAGIVMHAVQPVAAATGKAFDGFLGQFAATLQDPQWRQFWAFMAATAPQDMRLLGTLVIDLSNDLPQLVMQFQGLAVGMLTAADDTVKLVHGLDNVIATVNRPSDNTLLGKIDDAFGWLEKHLPAGNKSLTDLLGLTGKAGDAATTATPKLSGEATAAGALATQAGLAATAVAALNTAQTTALSTQLAYGNALVTAANDAQALKDKLKLSGGQIGLQTQAQRNSFSAANQYIADLGNTATTAIASGKGVSGAITAIQNGLPVLDSAKTKNKQYWKEVQTLVGWLDALRNEKAIQDRITLTGHATWQVAGTGGHGALFFKAAGGMIPGRGNADSVPAMLTPGEVVVPKRMVGAGAVDHLRGSLPGFAAGGLVGSYSGRVGGLPKWAGGEIAATIRAMASEAVSQAIAGVRAAASSGGGGIAAYARSFLGRIPYVWGGTSLSSGADCSGFTQAVYRHFGIGAPRTSEAQGGWVRRSPPVPGGLAFYVSPAGGPPPGHVAIVQDAGTVISQGGGLGPQLMGLHAMPLMWTGVPPSGFPGSGGMGGGQTGPGSVRGWILEAMNDTGAPGSWLAPLLKIQGLETDNLPNMTTVVNPNGDATGLMQVKPGTFKEFATVPGGIDNPVANSVAAIRHIMSAWGSPFNIPGIGKPGAYRGYDNGGVLPPGLSLSYNGLGRPEPLIAARGGHGDWGPDIVAELRAHNDLLAQLIGVSAQAPAVMGAALAGGARSATYRQLYS